MCGTPQLSRSQRHLAPATQGVSQFRSAEERTVDKPPRHRRENDQKDGKDGQQGTQDVRKASFTSR